MWFHDDELKNICTKLLKSMQGIQKVMEDIIISIKELFGANKLNYTF